MPEAANMYWNIGEILPYQRPFNFINGPRSIGKTYTCLKWLIKQALKGREFAYIVRTQDEKKSGVLEQALQKVLQNEYPDIDVIFSADAGVCEKRVLCRCFALTEAVKLKRRSFPNVHFFFFDEYTIEDGSARYINGFQEPELFFNIFHTVDREENRVRCFFMGNNTSYYNPYHLYPAFGLPGVVEMVEPGEIWTNNVTLFQRAIPSVELEEKRSGVGYLKALEKTRYGEYAVGGTYRDDGYQPIRSLGANEIYRATVHTPDTVAAIYTNPVSRTCTISDAVNESYRIKFSLVKEGFKDGYPYMLPVFKEWQTLLRFAVTNNQLFYTSMGVKAKVEPYLIKVI